MSPKKLKEKNEEEKAKRLIRKAEEYILLTILKRAINSSLMGKVKIEVEGESVSISAYKVISIFANSKRDFINKYRILY